MSCNNSCETNIPQRSLRKTGTFVGTFSKNKQISTNTRRSMVSYFLPCVHVVVDDMHALFNAVLHRAWYKTHRWYKTTNGAALCFCFFNLAGSKTKARAFTGRIEVIRRVILHTEKFSDPSFCILTPWATRKIILPSFRRINNSSLCQTSAE